jgi:CheY-like chemotaxis protein
MRRIAIIDDDPDILYLLKEVFEENGYEVGTWLDPLQGAGVQIVGFRPDVLLADVRMPGDGFALADELLRASHPPIVFMTGFHTPIDLEGHGAVAVIHKPFELTELLQVVDEACAIGWMRPLTLQRRRQQG